MIRFSARYTTWVGTQPARTQIRIPPAIKIHGRNSAKSGMNVFVGNKQRQVIPSVDDSAEDRKVRFQPTHHTNAQSANALFLETKTTINHGKKDKIYKTQVKVCEVKTRKYAIW